MQVNWLVRFKNKAFWVAFVPAIFMLIQTVAAIFGFEFDFTELSMQLLAAIDAIFVVLMILGIVADPTTKGLNDSAQAMQYQEPKSDVDVKNEGID